MRKTQYKKKERRISELQYNRNLSSLSSIMLKIIQQAQKRNEVGWNIQFNRMRNSIFVETMNDGYQITATDGTEEYAARLTKHLKSYMINGNDILFQRILYKKLEEQ